MPVAFIVSGEWNLRGAVRAELREAGVEALGFDTVADMSGAIARGIAPAVAVVDASCLREPFDRQALQNLAAHLPVLVIASRLDPHPPLPGAFVLLRPVQVKLIVARVIALLASPKPQPHPSPG